MKKKKINADAAPVSYTHLEDEGKLEMAGARGAVILSKSEMTAMEMVRTILALDVYKRQHQNS